MPVLRSIGPCVLAFVLALVAAATVSAAPTSPTRRKKEPPDRPDIRVDQG